MRDPPIDTPSSRRSLAAMKSAPRLDLPMNGRRSAPGCVSWTGGEGVGQRINPRQPLESIYLPTTLDVRAQTLDGPPTPTPPTVVRSGFVDIDTASGRQGGAPAPRTRARCPVFIHALQP